MSSNNLSVTFIFNLHACLITKKFLISRLIVEIDDIIDNLITISPNDIDITFRCKKDTLLC